MRKIIKWFKNLFKPRTVVNIHIDKLVNNSSFVLDDGQERPLTEKEKQELNNRIAELLKKSVDESKVII